MPLIFTALKGRNTAFLRRVINMVVRSSRVTNVTNECQLGSILYLLPPRKIRKNQKSIPFYNDKLQEFVFSKRFGNNCLTFVMRNSSKFNRCALLAISLLSLYAVHLTLFEALMLGSFQSKDNIVHFTFDRNSQTDSSHPCVAADYQRLLKHEDNKKHAFVFEPCKSIASLIQAIPGFQYPHQPIAYSPKLFHLSDGSFRRYSLLNVFLI
jgi:hypothetical protein